jgi:hypothetical protein
MSTTDLQLDSDGTLTVGTLRVTMHQEEELDVFDPRDHDNLGVMVCSHKRYRLGDHREGWVRELADDLVVIYGEHGEEGVLKHLKARLDATVVLPLYLIDHSGLAMRAGRSFSDIDPGEWDSGLVGFIFDTSKTREVTGVEPADIEKGLRAEVEEYDRWLQGDVWGYAIERLVTCSAGEEHAETVDGCCGFIGHEYAEGEALRAMVYEIKEETGE